MHWVSLIGVFIVAAVAGNAVAGLFPATLIPAPLRLPVGALLVGLGLAMFASQILG